MRGNHADSENSKCTGNPHCGGRSLNPTLLDCGCASLNSRQINRPPPHQPTPDHPSAATVNQNGLDPTFKESNPTNPDNGAKPNQFGKLFD
ncbi:unnamed protein product [[Candida] boidinii]|nr:unnamed protein product [[Candida] boidinii]